MLWILFIIQNILWFQVQTQDGQIKVSGVVIDPAADVNFGDVISQAATLLRDNWTRNYPY